MAEQSTLETMLRLQVDASDAARVIKSIERTRDAMKDLQRATVAQDNAAKASTKTIRDQASALEDAAKQAKAAQDAAGRIQSATGGLRGVASAVGATGVSGGLNVAADVAGLAEELPKLKESLLALPDAAKSAVSALGVGGIGLGAALLALGGAIAILTQQNQAAIDALNQRIAKEYEYNNLTARLNQEQIQKLIDAKQTEIDVAQANLEDQRRISAEAIQNVLDTSSSIELGIRGILNIFQPDEATAAAKAYTDAQNALTKLNTAMDNLKNAMNDGSVVARSAAEAEAALAAARQKLTDQLADVQISTLLRASSMSSEAANKRLEDIRKEIEVTQQFVDSGTLSAEKTTELKDRITKLAQEMVTLNTQVLPVIQARERESAALEYQKKQLEDTAAAVKKYNEDVASIERKNLEARQQASERYYDRVTAIAEAAAQAAENALRQLEQRRADLSRDLGRAGEDAERKRQQDELDAQIDFQREEAKAAREHADELKRIRRQAMRDESQAIQDRDAVALDAAQTRKKDEIQNANENYQQAARERAIAFAQEASDRRTAFERDRQDRILKYQRDLADAQAAYQADLALAAAKRQQDLAQARLAYQQDLITLQQKYTQELSARKLAAIAEIRLIQQTEAQRVTIMAQAQQALINQARQMLMSAGATAASAIPLTGGVGNHSYPTPPSLDTGGHITKTGYALVHRGESIVNPARGQSAGGSIVVNLNGVQMKEINARSKQHAIDTVVDALKEML